MSLRASHAFRALLGRAVATSAALLTLVVPLLVIPSGISATAQAQEAANGDPSELFLKAFTSVQQGEKLETDGRLKPALAKYRFAASLLEQLNQANPNWQPLIVRYRMRKTTENIQSLEEKIKLQPNVPDSGLNGGPTVGVNIGANRQRPPSASDPVEDNALPSWDDPSNGTGSNGQQRSATASPQGPSTEYLDRTALDLRAKLDRTQKDLNDALNQLSVAQKDKKQALRDKQDIEFQLHSTKSSAAAAQKKFERIKADRDDLETQVTKAETRLKEVQAKSPDAAETRKELRDQVADLKKSLAKAQADTEAAAKAKEELEKKVASGAIANAAPTLAGDASASVESAAKIQSLEAENAILTQKLSTAESSIAELHAESAKKKEELDGVRKELGTLQEQLVASRDQNDRSATTVTELRKQLDENAEQLTQLKTKGATSEEALRMTKENELLRGIVLRQLKDQARRDAARELLKTELARLEVQSKTLNEQVEILGRPTVQLTDEERNLFKDPQVSISDNSSTDPATMATTITAIRPHAPEAASSPAPEQAPTDPTTGTPPSASPAAGTETASAGAASSAPGSPKVETAFQPKVADPLKPLAREAKDAFDGGHYIEAEKAYDRLLAKEPKNPYLLSNQGVVLFREDKLKNAEVMLKKATTIAPKDAFSQATLGIVYYRMHRYDEAISSLTQAIQLDPKNATAHNYLGITSSQKGWPEAAIDEIQKAIALNPNYADAHFNIAVIYATNQPPAKDRAEEHYKIATSLGATPDPALEKLIKN